MKKAVEELIALLKNSSEKMMDKGTPTFSHAIEEQLKTLVETAETQLKQWDFSDLDMLEKKLISCSSLLSSMIDDIEQEGKQYRLKSASQDPSFEKIKGYLLTQQEALTLIQEKIICAKISHHVQQLEERIQQLLFSTGPSPEAKNEIQKYFTQLANEVSSSFEKEDSKNKFTFIVSVKKKNWPSEMHDFYAHELTAFLSNYYKK